MSASSGLTTSTMPATRSGAWQGMPAWHGRAAWQGRILSSGSVAAMVAQEMMSSALLSGQSGCSAGSGDAQMVDAKAKSGFKTMYCTVITA